MISVQLWILSISCIFISNIIQYPSSVFSSFLLGMRHQAFAYHTLTHTRPLKFAFAGAIRPVAQILPPGPLEAPGHLGISFGLSKERTFSFSSLAGLAGTGPTTEYNPLTHHPCPHPSFFKCIFDGFLPPLHIDMHFRVVVVPIPLRLAWLVFLFSLHCPCNLLFGLFGRFSSVPSFGSTLIQLSWTTTGRHTGRSPRLCLGS